MAQTDRTQGRESPKTPTSPTIEQLLREGDGSWWSTPSSSSSPHARNHDQEEDHGHHQRKSMLTKVKEKAKKLRHSLSTKKKHSNEDENTTPAWGVSLEDDEDEEEDAEYLGAPMYESELAPESYKEIARQHPRANPVISEKTLFGLSIVPEKTSSSH
ncbi:uncharacterized protein LOC21407997 [Morus notabilis]|nr:uncharacterized protein LOC21407997 [Morus notabilis]